MEDEKTGVGMIEATLNWFAGIGWASVFSGAALGGLAVGLRTILQAPMKAMTEQSVVIRALHHLSPQRPFDGRWRVDWNVESSKFPPVNTDQVRIYSLFGNVTFTTETTLTDGAREKCVFVGKLVDRTLTGRWFDPKDANRAYFGVFQVRLKGGLRDAAGKWSGWTNDGYVQSNEMTMARAD